MINGAPLLCYDMSLVIPRGHLITCPCTSGLSFGHNLRENPKYIRIVYPMDTPKIYRRIRNKEESWHREKKGGAPTYRGRPFYNQDAIMRLIVAHENFFIFNFF